MAPALVSCQRWFTQRFIYIFLQEQSLLCIGTKSPRENIGIFVDQIFYGDPFFIDKDSSISVVSKVQSVKEKQNR